MKILPLASVLVGVALLASACGSDSPTSSTMAKSASSSFQSALGQAFKYSTCMRDHGVTNFPDPKVINKPGEQGIAIHAVGGGPTFAAAQKACGGILPQPSNADEAAQAAQRRVHTSDLLSFARCMRGRGVSDFPDPDSQGNLPLSAIGAAGIDIHAPRFAAAARTCIPASHGILTPAMVAQATGSGG